MTLQHQIHYGTFKEAASQDAKGSLARLVVLNSESPERFEKLRTALMEEFQPCTYMEQTFVDSMAVTRWRLIRNGTFTIAILNEPDSGHGLQMLLREKRILQRMYSSSRRMLLDLRSRKTLAAS